MELEREIKKKILAVFLYLQNHNMWETVSLCESFSNGADGVFFKTGLI